MADSRGVRDARALGAVLALALALAPSAALADEALLPTPEDLEGVGVSADEATQLDEPEDPTDEGLAVPGAEPDGEALAAALDGYFAQNFPASGLPGAAVAVVDSGGVRYQATFGDVADAHSTFMVGSLSKSLTAVAVMKLVEQGSVDLDAPAARYVPAYGVSGVVTVRDLLNQTSGFGYYEPLSDAEVGCTLGSFSYANANYDLLGRIVEAVSGQSYGDYLAEHVFGPLGMGDASVLGEPGRAAEAPGHRSWFGLDVADGFVHEQGDDAWGGPASGYVRASISDMASYLQMYLNNGRGALSSDSVHQMIFDRVPDLGSGTYYGMGWTSFTWDDGELVLSHDGQVENYVARMCVIPGRDLALVMLADSNDEFGGNDAFFDMADDVLMLSLGAEAGGVDPSDHALTHVVYDAAYLVAVVAAAAPLALACARRRRGVRARARGVADVLLAVGLHVALPVYLLLLPSAGLGMRMRDFADFYPDQALVLLACSALLVAGGLVKAFLPSRFPAAPPEKTPVPKMAVGGEKTGLRLPKRVRE